MDEEKVEPIPQPSKSNEDEDESEDPSSSSEEEDESEGDDSGLEENEGTEPEDESEDDTEGESKMAKDFCTHQETCASTEECVIYRTKVNEENKRLRMKLKKLRAEQKPIMEKKRALSILKQTINVESKIARLEQVLTWMYKAKEKMSSERVIESGQVGRDGRQKQGSSVTDGSPNDMGYQEDRVNL